MIVDFFYHVSDLALIRKKQIINKMNKNVNKNNFQNQVIF